MRQFHLLICLQILQIRINKTELNKEKKGKHSGIILCPADSYKNQKKNLQLVDIKETMIVFDLFEPKWEAMYHHRGRCCRRDTLRTTLMILGVRSSNSFFFSFFLSFLRELLTVYVSDPPHHDSYKVTIVWSYWTALAAKLVDSDVPLGSMRLEGPAEIQAMR